MPIPMTPEQVRRKLEILRDHGNSYAGDHIIRMEHTWRFFSGRMGGNERVLEAGGESIFGHLIRESWAGVHLEPSRGDLRLSESCWWGVDNSWDLVVATEVIEHLDDPWREPGHPDFGRITREGMKNFLRGALRAVRPGGAMLLSTPRLDSWDALVKIARGDDPFVWSPHFRERTRKDTLSLVREAGWIVEAESEVTSWVFSTTEQTRAAADFCRVVGGDTSKRGNMMLLWMAKTA